MVYDGPERFGSYRCPRVRVVSEVGLPATEEYRVVIQQRDTTGSWGDVAECLGAYGNSPVRPRYDALAPWSGRILDVWIPVLAPGVYGLVVRWSGGEVRVYRGEYPECFVVYESAEAFQRYTLRRLFPAPPYEVGPRHP